MNSTLEQVLPEKYGMEPITYHRKPNFVDRLPEEDRNSKNVSIIKGFKYFGDQSLTEVFNQIKDGLHKSSVLEIRCLISKEDRGTANVLKSSLNAFTPCCLVKDGSGSEHIVQYNQLVILDYDYIPQELYSDAFKIVTSIPYTYMAFKSPSGNGIKVLVHIDSHENHHKQAFSQVTEHYDKLLKLDNDPKGKNITRLCFMSYDPDAYLNSSSEVFPVVIKKELNIAAKKHDLGIIWDKAKTATNKTYTYQDGQRNSYVHTLAGWCNRFGIDQSQAHPLILNNYGYDKREVESSIKSAYKNVGEFGTYLDSNIRVKSQSTTGIPKFNKDVSISLPLGQMLNRIEDEPKRKFVYPGIHENSFGLVYGLAKTGKTIFCENFGMAIAAGRKEYLGKPINIDNRKVLFMSLEENYLGRGERNLTQLGSFDKNERESILANYYVVDEHIPRMIETESDWKIITDQIEKVKPGIVFLDSLTRLVSDIENLEPARHAMLRIRDIAEQYQVTVVVIHHSIKIDHSQPMTIQNIAGSRVVSQEADFVIGINKSIINQRYIKLIFARYDRDNNEKVELFNIDDYISIKLTGEEYETNLLAPKIDNRRNDDNAGKVYQLIQGKDPEVEILTKELRSCFVDVKPQIMSEPTLQTALKKLVYTGKIEKVGHGIYKTCAVN